MGKVDIAVKTYNSSLCDLALVVVIDNRNDGKKIRTTVDATFNTVQEIRDVFGKQRIINDGYPLRCDAYNLGLTKQELLDWIYMEDFESRHKAVRSKRVTDSGIWFLNHPVFETWGSGDSADNLFCPGLGIALFS
jgi:hypothetical protein